MYLRFNPRNSILIKLLFQFGIQRTVWFLWLCHVRTNLKNSKRSQNPSQTLHGPLRISFSVHFLELLQEGRLSYLPKVQPLKDFCCTLKLWERKFARLLNYRYLYAFDTSVCLRDRCSVTGLGDIAAFS